MMPMDTATEENRLVHQFVFAIAQAIHWKAIEQEFLYPRVTIIQSHGLAIRLSWMGWDGLKEVLLNKQHMYDSELIIQHIHRGDPFTPEYFAKEFLEGVDRDTGAIGSVTR